MRRNNINDDCGWQCMVAVFFQIVYDDVWKALMDSPRETPTRETESLACDRWCKVKLTLFLGILGRNGHGNEPILNLHWTRIELDLSSHWLIVLYEFPRNPLCHESNVISAISAPISVIRVPIPPISVIGPSPPCLPFATFGFEFRLTFAYAYR